MALIMQNNNEEILWQSKISLKFQIIIFFISSVVLVIGILSEMVIRKLISSIQTQEIFFILLVFVHILITFLTIGLPLVGILYSIFMWISINYISTSYFGTKTKIVDKRIHKEYVEYFTFEYSKINKIEIQLVRFLKDKVAKIRIFPKLDTANPFKWKYRIFKEQGVKLPLRLQRNYHLLYNVSNYKPLLEILEQNHVKIIYK